MRWSFIKPRMALKSWALATLLPYPSQPLGPRLSAVIAGLNMLFLLLLRFCFYICLGFDPGSFSAVQAGLRLSPNSLLNHNAVHREGSTRHLLHSCVNLISNSLPEFLRLAFHVCKRWKVEVQVLRNQQSHFHTEFQTPAAFLCYKLQTWCAPHHRPKGNQPQTEISKGGAK